MKQGRPSVLMVAYTDYASDPRVIREAEAALSAGFAVDFLALRRQGDPNIALVRGVRVFHLNQRRYRGGGHVNYLFAYLQFFVRCFFKATWLFFKNRYAVVHVNNMPDFLVFCSLIPKICGARIILDIHDPMPNTFASKFGENHYGFFYYLLLWQERLSAWYADKTLTVHEPVKHGILVKHGLNPDSIHVVANFADDELFQLQHSYSIDGKLRLVFHGTILKRYGLGNVVLAVSRLKRRENISVRIIGEGDFSTELSKMIAALRLQETVHFINYVYPLQQIPALISDCNLGLVPLEMSSATNYGLPLKLLRYHFAWSSVTYHQERGYRLLLWAGRLPLLRSGRRRLITPRFGKPRRQPGDTPSISTASNCTSREVPLERGKAKIHFHPARAMQRACCRNR